LLLGVSFVTTLDEFYSLSPYTRRRERFLGFEANESPLAACIREVREELGFDLRTAQLRCIDYRVPVDGLRGSALIFVFFGGVLLEAETQSF
jgi:8-oxo-dGTP pyrophosphatase MutT (NUDIX family)